ncbi:MAG: GNAT family N-acetyltransferase [Rhodobiaceae bacterium]|nr:GNAT family N-acetyltransferase [Rhodobiaceae bacterium]
MKNIHLWHVESACWTAWPSAEDKMIDGWLCRASGGETKRTNSANATLESCSIRGVVEPVAKFYADRDQPLLFRTVSLMPEIEQALAASGFQPEAETCTLEADLSKVSEMECAGIELHSNPSDEWIADKLRLSPMTPAQQEAYRAMLARISVPACFARSVENGNGLSLAYGAIVEGILVIESVVTDPAHRGKGLAGKVVGSLMTWAAGKGATLSCLQVEAENAPARRLYKKLGYETELYRYRYWRDPATAIRT